jgi:hypothetical protein
MQYTHPLDRFMVRIRPALIGMAVLSLPVMLISYGVMLANFVTSQPDWLGALVFSAHFVGWICISALIDSLREKRTPRPADQS